MQCDALDISACVNSMHRGNEPTIHVIHRAFPISFHSSFDKSIRSRFFSHVEVMCDCVISITQQKEKFHIQCVCVCVFNKCQMSDFCVFAILVDVFFFGFDIKVFESV